MRVTSSSNRRPLGNPSMFGMNSILVLVLYIGSTKPNTAACTSPRELNFASVLFVAGTAIFRRSISPPFGRKLLTKGLPAASGFPAGLPVANWYGLRFGTPVWKIGQISTERGLPAAGNNNLPAIASSNAVPASAGLPLRMNKPSCPFLKSNFPKDLL